MFEKRKSAVSVRIGTPNPRPSTTPVATRSLGPPARRRRAYAATRTAARIPNASVEPMSMFHQSDVIPRAALLCGWSASCCEPQPAHSNSGTSAVDARRQASPVVNPENGYPRPTPSNGAHRIAVALGASTLVAAQLAPLTDRFWEHMLQHLLIGDVAPLLVALGGIRLRVHPLVALPVWAANLCLWHLTPLYDAALRHSAVHL